MIPLMQGGADPVIIGQWRRLAEAEPDAERRADYGGLALLFAELAGCLAVWDEVLRGWNVQQSKQVLKWQAEARKQGKAEGKAEVILRFLQRGTRRAVPRDLATAIRNTDDLTVLDHWIDVAADVTSFEEFRRRANLRNGAG